MATRPLAVFGRVVIPYTVDTRLHEFRYFVQAFDQTTLNFIAGTGVPANVGSSAGFVIDAMFQLFNPGQAVAFGSVRYERLLGDGSFVQVGGATITPTTTRLGSSTFINPSNQLTLTLRSTSYKTARVQVFGVPFEFQNKLIARPTAASGIKSLVDALIGQPRLVVTDRAGFQLNTFVSLSWDTNDKFRRVYNQV